MLYYQCDLSQCSARTTGYIEDRGAKLGAHVEIKEPGFDGLWLVEQVADRGVDASVLREKQRMDRNAFGSII